jgi:hypothetical protein
MLAKEGNERRMRGASKAAGDRLMASRSFNQRKVVRRFSQRPRSMEGELYAT